LTTCFPGVQASASQIDVPFGFGYSQGRAISRSASGALIPPELSRLPTPCECCADRPKRPSFSSRSDSFLPFSRPPTIIPRSPPAPHRQGHCSVPAGHVRGLSKEPLRLAKAFEAVTGPAFSRLPSRRALSTERFASASMSPSRRSTSASPNPVPKGHSSRTTERANVENLSSCEASGYLAVVMPGRFKLWA